MDKNIIHLVECTIRGTRAKVTLCKFNIDPSLERKCTVCDTDPSTLQQKACGRQVAYKFAVSLEPPLEPEYVLYSCDALTHSKYCLQAATGIVNSYVSNSEAEITAYKSEKSL